MFTLEGDLDKHLETTHCTSNALNVDDHLNLGCCNVQSDGFLNSNDGEGQIATGVVQNEHAILESVINVPNVDVDSVTETSDQYGRSFSRYLQVMYHKIIRNYRKYRPKECSAEIVKISQRKRSNSNGRRNRETNSDNCTSTSRKPFHCNECGRRFHKESTFRVHLRVHTGEKPYQCFRCEKSFAQKGNLTVHLKSHTGYQCSKCDKTFMRKKSLIEHQRIHNSERPYNLRVDIRNKPHKCDMCHESFTMKSHFTKNLRNHTGKKSLVNNVHDEGCLQRGCSAKELGTAFRNETYQCDHCDKVFNEKSYLAQHIKLQSGVKPYKCDQCDKTFALKNYLVVHLRIHTGEKSHKCIRCDKAFSQKCTLNQHLKIHSGEKPFQCNQCGKVFALKWYLKSHTRTHR